MTLATEGVCYVAFGRSYFEMAMRSVQTLRHFEPSLPVVVLVDRETPVGRTPPPGVAIVRLDLDRDQNRAVKTRLPEFVRFRRGVYLDADTVILRPIRDLFRHLEAFDLCAAFCAYCINANAGHLSTEDRESLLAVCPPDSLHFQCGVFAWRRTAEALDFFRLWNEEWQRFRKHDQGAFARAVWRSRARLGVLWRDEWNALTHTLHRQKRIIHYATRKAVGLGDVFPVPSSAESPAGRSTAPAEVLDREGCPAAQNRGVAWVACGDEDFRSACEGVATLRGLEPDLDVTILTDRERRLPADFEGGGDSVRVVATGGSNGISLQTHAIRHLEYDRCIVLAADCRVLRPVSPLFRHLEAFDLCLAMDPRGVMREARSISRNERAETFALCPDSSLLYEPGVACWKRTAAVERFHELWHEEWRRFRAETEGALARAIWRSDVRVGVLWPGRWNHCNRFEGLHVLRTGMRNVPVDGGRVTRTLTAEALNLSRNAGRRAAQGSPVADRGVAPSGTAASLFR